MTSMKNRLIAVLTAAALFLAACGGSGSDSEPAPTPDPDDGTGGITGTGVAVGPITGFGSVIVNGVTYDTDAAEFTRATSTPISPTSIPASSTDWWRPSSTTRACTT